MNINLEVISIPALVTIIYVLIELIKYTLHYSEKFKRLIPITSVILGSALGIATYYLIPSILPTENLAIAIIIGGASGLTATGTNQIFKQLNNK